jgi:hypothetical protein
VPLGSKHVLGHSLLIAKISFSRQFIALKKIIFLKERDCILFQKILSITAFSRFSPVKCPISYVMSSSEC